VHFLRDCLGHARRDRHGLLAALIRPIFNADSHAQARDRLSEAVAHLDGRLSKVAAMLEDAEPDILAFYAFPPDHWRKLRSTDENVKGSMAVPAAVMGRFWGVGSVGQAVRSAADRLLWPRSGRIAGIGPISGMRRLRRRLRRAGRDRQCALGCAVGVVDPRAKRRIWG